MRIPSRQRVRAVLSVWPMGWGVRGWAEGGWGYEGEKQFVYLKGASRFWVSTRTSIFPERKVVFGFGGVGGGWFGMLGVGPPDHPPPPSRQPNSRQHSALIWFALRCSKSKQCTVSRTPPPPCASTALSKHGVGVEPLFLGISGTTVLGVPDVTWGSKTVYHTLPPDDVCFDVILSHS